MFTRNLQRAAFIIPKYQVRAYSTQTLRTLKVDGTCVNYQTKAKADEHTIVIDEPKMVGGGDTGADPLRFYLSSLMGCLNATARMYAKKMNLNLGDINFTIKGVYDPAGFQHPEEVSAKFQSITIDAQVQTSESKQKLDELIKKTEDTCPLSRLTKDAKVDLKLNWKASQ